MNQEKRNPIVVLCELLPPSLVVLEKNGFCQKPDCDCEYNKDRLNLSPDDRLCYKKTLTPDLPLTRGSLA